MRRGEPPDMAGPLRVFVNERPVDVARGASVRDAVAALDGALAELLGDGAAYVTDATGRPVDAGDPVGEAGAVLRVVVTARRGPPRLSKEVLRRWPKAELHVHLDGCLRPQTMLELARVQGIRLPAGTVGGGRAGGGVRGRRGCSVARWRGGGGPPRRAPPGRASRRCPATAWRAPATPGRGMERAPSTRRCTSAGRSASATARGWVRTRRCWRK